MTEVGSALTPHICRLCLAQTTVCFSLIEDTEASGMLEALTSLRILPTDEISTIMCLKCRLNLKLAFSIQQNMLRAERRFREQHSSLQIKEEFPEFEHIEIDETVELPEDRLQLLLKEATANANTHQCEICGVVKSSKRTLQLHHYHVHKSRKCPECDKEITLGKFKRHLDQHHGVEEESGIFSCQICGIVKTSKRLLRHHNYNVHVTKKCPQCGEDVKLNKFREHIDGHNGTLSYTCDICGVNKSSKKNLAHHKYNVHMSKKCPHCNKDVKLTKFKNHVDRHKPNQASTKEESQESEQILDKEHEPRNEHNPKEIFTCNICGCAKSSKRNLQHHKYSVHRFRKCLICDKVIKSSYYRRHLAKHSSNLTPEEASEINKRLNRTHACDACDVVEDSQTALIKHKYDVHMEGKCPICAKPIKQINIQRHMERHKNVQTVCEICGVTMNSHDLNSHMHYAHKQRSFKCQFCDRTYKKKQSVVAHEKREHLKKADFVCDTCGKRFHARLHLKKHIDGTHLKLRPFVCEFCKVGFSSRFALCTHRRQHTNETPYKCEFCTEAFRQKVSLRAHLRSKHGVKEELTCECPTCGRKFASSAALIAHGRIH